MSTGFGWEVKAGQKGAGLPTAISRGPGCMHSTSMSPTPNAGMAPTLTFNMGSDTRNIIIK